MFAAQGNNGSENGEELQNLGETTPQESSGGVVMQTGVARAEAVARTWTKQSLWFAYAGYEAYYAIYCRCEGFLTSRLCVEYFLWRFVHRWIFRLLVYSHTMPLHRLRHIHYCLLLVLSEMFSMVRLSLHDSRKAISQKFSCYSTTNGQSRGCLWP